WHVMGVVQAAGLSLQWFRNQFCAAEMQAAEAMGTDPYVLMNEAIAHSPIGANRLLYLPYLMGERTPHLDPDCRGAFVGLSAMHTRRDLMRAVMEGATYALKDSLTILNEMKAGPTEMLACGGGSKSPLWRQMLADMFGLPVRTALSSEGPALGVAILAGVGTGVFKDVRSACRDMINYGDALTPDAAANAYYARGYAAYQGLYPALKGSFETLKTL
ncbi:MAG: xylulokinase, partial [Oscillospiraceae bacterium]|nr:xylulokinase [Oscillospiraceae bacterium]